MVTKTKFCGICTSLLWSLFFLGCLEKEKPAISQNTQTQTTEQSIPAGEKIGEEDPIANPLAKPGGEIITWGGDFPKSLNYYLDPNYANDYINNLMFEMLFDLHSVENRYIGLLAETWELSEDKKTYTVHIRPEAKWSDGKPVVAEDVQFFYDVIMDPKNLTPVERVSLKRFSRPEIISDKVFSVTAEKDHWKNERDLGRWVAFPKHAWKGKDFNKINFDFNPVYGPYVLSEVKKGRAITLSRRADWWGRILAYNNNKYNVDKLGFKFIVDRNIALESFKKGDMDIYPIYTSSIWVKQTNFDQVKNNWVLRQKIFNKEPMGFQGFAFNLRREKFQNIKTRQALCHLLNRELMNEKLMYNEYFLLSSYYSDLFPNKQNPKNPIRKYNPDLARKLLSEAGWKIGSSGFLEQDGLGVFEIVFLTYSADQRHLQVYLEDLKKVGIKASIEKLSQSSLSKRMDKFDFDMYWSAWAGDRMRDPESQWHSSTANQEASYNFPGVEDAVVDSLIEAMKLEWDLDKRNNILKELDSRLFAIIPYALLWMPDYNRILYWNKYGTPKYVYDKYGAEDKIVAYWWLDADKNQALENAKANNQKLGDYAANVYYKE